MTPFDGSGKEDLKTLREREKLLVQAISPFPTMFSTLSKTEIISFITFNLLSANAFNLDWSKILSCGNGLSYSMMQFVFDWTENILGKRENPGYQHFVFILRCLQKASTWDGGTVDCMIQIQASMNIIFYRLVGMCYMRSF